MNIRAAFRRIFSKHAGEHDLESELRHHLDEQIEANIAAGMAPEEARRQAMIAFGGVDKTKELCRDVRPFKLLEDLAQDVRYGLRQLRRSPGFTIVAVLTLALGVGANTAIFSLLHQVLLRSLPVQNPEELVVLNSPGDLKVGSTSTDDSGGRDAIFSYRMFRELEKKPQGVTAIAGFRLFNANLSFNSESMNGPVMAVSGSYFSVLGVQPFIGRLISADDDQPGAGRAVAVLSYGYWRDHMGGRPEVLNQPLRLNAQLFTIAGVAPRGFSGTTLGDQPDVFVPLSLKPLLDPGWNGADNWNEYWVYVFARLKPGVSRQQAEAGLNSVYAGLVEEQANATHDSWPIPEALERFRKSRLTLLEGKQGQSDARVEARTPLLIMMASTLLVLLIAVATVANLLLARGAERKKELAIRAVLGAGRSRVMRQVLTEVALLALAGGVAGVLVAWWAASVLATAMSDGTPPEALQTPLNWQVLLFAAGISALAGFLCGLYPAWESTRTSLTGALKDQAGQVSASLRSARMRKALVCVQVVISALLLIPTGLFLKSLVNLLHVDLGFQTEKLLTFRVSPELNGYNPEQSRALYERMEEQLSGLPGIRSVSAAAVPLVANTARGSNLTVGGYSRDPRADTNSMFNVVGSGFFGKLGIPLIAGREFSERDAPAGAKVAVVNETFARHFFGAGSPIGRRFGRGRGNKVTLDFEIVGLVKDSHYSNIKQTPPRVYYTPWRQSENAGSLTFYIRTALPEQQMVPQIRRIMNLLDSNLPLAGVRTVDEQIRSNIHAERAIFQLSAIFSGLATLLAMLGLYGVMAYSVTRRTREIGIRLALGAPVGSIAGMVMRELLVVLATGLALGIPAAIALARFTESQLYGVRSFDAQIIAATIVALSVASLAAGYLPLYRATRVDPVVALHYE